VGIVHDNSYFNNFIEEDMLIDLPLAGRQFMIFVVMDAL
jgi:hypothetical protein